MHLDDLDIAALRRRRGEKWATYPDDVLPAWVADMDFPVCPAIGELLARHLELGDLGYPTDAAPQAVREAFATRARDRFDWHVEPHRVEVISDVVQGMYVALATMTEAGDAAIVHPPIYPPFLIAVPELARRLVISPLRDEGGGYCVDFDHLRASTDRQTRMLLFCNPQNPSGRVFARRELEQIAEFVLERDLIVCSDEIHADLVFPGHRHIPFASLAPEIAARTVTLTSASKAFNIAGLRCAVAVFAEDALQRRFNVLPAHLRGGLGALGMAATVRAWLAGQPWLDEILQYLDANRAYVADFVATRLPGVRHSPPEATYLAWLDCRALDLRPDPYRFFLERGRVALSDGAAFGAAGEGFVRLNFATSRPILSAVLERMCDALDEAQSDNTR